MQFNISIEKIAGNIINTFLKSHFIFCELLSKCFRMKMIEYLECHLLGQSYGDSFVIITFKLNRRHFAIIKAAQTILLAEFYKYSTKTFLQNLMEISR